jgi:uncharacterized membrane protein SpoIIM required for sporulation
VRDGPSDLLAVNRCAYLALTPSVIPLRRHELTANAIIHFPLIVLLGMLLFGTYPVNIAVILILYLCGLIDLIYSKLPLFRHRVFNSIGPRHIPKKRREAYFRGYIRIALGAAFNLLVTVH